MQMKRSSGSRIDNGNTTAHGGGQVRPAFACLFIREMYRTRHERLVPERTEVAQDPLLVWGESLHEARIIQGLLLLVGSHSL